MSKLRGEVILGLVVICLLLVGGYYIYRNVITHKSQRADKEIEGRMERTNTIKALYPFFTPSRDVMDTTFVGVWLSDTDAIQKRLIRWQFNKYDSGLRLTSNTGNSMNEFSVKVSSDTTYPNAFEAVGTGTSVFFHDDKEWKIFFYYLRDKNLIMEINGQPTPGSDERMDIVFRKK